MAYNIVREADLMCAYDFDRCMIYSMYQRRCSIEDAFDDAHALFERRVFRHNDDGLFFTKFAQNNRIHFETEAHVRIAHWKKINCCMLSRPSVWFMYFLSHMSCNTAET